MASSPRIVIVDPNDLIPQQVEAAFTLIDRYVTTIKVFLPDDALEEVEAGRVNTVVAAWQLGRGVQGWELAAKVKEIDPNVHVVLLGNYRDDPEPDDEALEQSLFVYLKRPYDPPQLLRILEAAIDNRDIFEAQYQKNSQASSNVPDLGPVPEINAGRSQAILDALLRELPAMAILLAGRDGSVVTEVGTLSHPERDEIVSKTIPAMLATVDLRDVIGGNASSLQYFDGDDTDIYVISVGLHYFVAIIFDGASGSRQFGAVSRFGRRGAEDLIGILGAEAWFIQPPMLEPDPVEAAPRKQQPRVEEETVQLERAQLTSKTEKVEADAPDLQVPQMEAIADLDLDILFGSDSEDGDADNLFDLDAMEELAKETEGSRRNTIDWDAAQDLGLLNSD